MDRIIPKADRDHLAGLTRQMRDEAVRARRLAERGEVSLVDASEALLCGLVAMRARLEPALDPCIKAEPILRP